MPLTVAYLVVVVVLQDVVLLDLMGGSLQLPERILLMTSRLYCVSILFCESANFGVQICEFASISKFEIVHNCSDYALHSNEHIHWFGACDAIYRQRTTSIADLSL